MVKHRNYRRPPLPFIGSKLRWWRELQILAAKLPHGGCVFDAFGGSFSAARVIKDTRPDLTVITNDYCHDYRRRLDAAPQTAYILKQLQAIAPKRSYTEYSKFDKEMEAECIGLVSDAEDHETVFRWLRGTKTIRNLIPNGEPVCPAVCDDWTKGLVVIDDKLTEYEARYWVESGAFIILDPPYTKNVKMGFDRASTYQDGRFDAQEFCIEIMRKSDRWCLFERPGSMLVRAAKDIGAVEVERLHGRNRQNADETMMVCAAYGAKAT